MTETVQPTRRRFLAFLALPVIVLTQRFPAPKAPSAMAWRQGGAPRGNLLRDD